MNLEEQKAKLTKMLQKCPEILSPIKALKWMPIGKNTLYAAIKNGEIEAFPYKGSHILTKDAVIDYIIKTSNDKGRASTLRGAKKVSSSKKILATGT